MIIGVGQIHIQIRKDFMTKEELNIYMGYILIFVFIISEIILYRIIKRDWDNKKLMTRNYIFSFLMGVGFLLTIFVSISLYHKIS